MLAAKFGFYTARQLSLVIPKLAHIPYAEHLAQLLLQVTNDLHYQSTGANAMMVLGGVLT